MASAGARPASASASRHARLTSTPPMNTELVATGGDDRFRPVLGLTEVRRALCIAAHPDDEILGAGATLAALGDRGVETHVLVLGEGVGARFSDDDRPDDEVAELASELRRAAEIIGAIPHQLDLPDNRFDRLDTLDVV